MSPIIADVLLVGAIGAIVWLFWKLRRVQRENRQMVLRLDEVDRMKKNFISHVSHELKAPLASMQETTHLILERIPGPLTDKQTRLLELNLQSGKRLAQMIGNILDLTRLQAGIVEYEMQKCDIADLVHNVVMELGSHARQKSLRVLTDIQRDPLYVACDSNRMVQLFTNLIENAIRFSPKSGTISIRVQAADNSATVSIADSGPGIEDDQKEQVFQTFHQLKQGKKSLGESLGLGLAISRALVEAHDGKIWIEDNPGGGSVFSVRLPRLFQDNVSKAS